MSVMGDCIVFQVGDREFYCAQHRRSAEICQEMAENEPEEPEDDCQ